MTDLAKRLGNVLRGAQDQKLGHRAVRAGLLSDEECAACLAKENGGIEALLRSKGIQNDQIHRLKEEIAREDFALFKPDRPPPAEVLAAGNDPERRLAEFVLVSRLGQGGIGEVWKAWDMRLGRWVAIKLPVATPDQEEIAKRFTREALAAARLSHPNIVSIFRVAEEGGRTFIVMQYVEGKVLTDLRLGLREALGVLESVSLAVHYAHEQGVIHRDLKPGNIMVGADGRAFILDFGLAHLQEAGRAHSRDNLVAGTAAYMSPEQARGEPGARERATDIYSLGATLYEAVTGRPPFEGVSFAGTLEKVLYRDAAAPRVLNPSVPRDVETVILKAMDKDPRRRYATARELAEDLDRCRRGDPVAARPTSFTRTLRRGLRKHPRASSLAGVFVVGLMALLLWAGVESHRERQRRVESFRERAQDALQAVLALRRVGANDGMADFAARLEESYRETVARAPGAAEVDHLLGRVERAGLEDALAIGFQRRALEKDPEFAPALYEQIVLLSRRGPRGRDEIVRAGERLRLEKLGPAESLTTRGILAFCKGEVIRSRELLEKAIAADPSLVEAWEALARSWLSIGPYAPPASQEEAYREAVESLTRAIERDRGYVPHWIARGKARGAKAVLLSETGQEPDIEFQSAEDDFTEALKLRVSAETLIQRAMLRARLGAHRARLGAYAERSFHEAAADLEQALRAEPDSSAALRAGCLVNRLEAEQHLRTAQNVIGECESIERDAAKAGAWLDRAAAWGYRAAKEEEFSKAELFFTEALKSDAGDPEVWERRAYVRLRRGALDEAEKDATRAIQMAPFFNRARLTRAVIRRARANYSEALKDLESVLSINAVDTDAWAERGRLELDWGRSQAAAGDRAGAREHFIQAVRHLEEATRLNPDLLTLLRPSLREAQRAVLGSN